MGRILDSQPVESELVSQDSELFLGGRLQIQPDNAVGLRQAVADLFGWEILGFKDTVAVKTIAIHPAR